jgi:proteasome lid subunit RPN8/RPN11
LTSLNVDSKVIDKIIESSNKTEDGRVIGLLIGSVEGDEISVQDAIQTRHLEDERGIKIHPTDIAEIAQKLLDKKLRGNVIGWFHTHPGYGAYMSDVDVQTQRVLQQFSPFMVSLVVDPKKKEAKFFTLNEDNKVKEFRGGKLNRVGKDVNAIQRLRESASTAPPPYPTAPSKPPLSKRQVYLLITTLVLVGVLLAGIFTVFALKAPAVYTLPTIQHTPVQKGEVGKEITLKAKVTGGEGGIHNVTLSYEWSEWTLSDEGTLSTIEHPWKTTLMLLVAAGGDEYAYTIPSSEVAGDIDYFITAFDKAEHTVSTVIYTIKVSDFQLEAETDTLIVHLGETQRTSVVVKPINEFQSPVELKVEKTPYGIQATVKPSSITPPKGGEVKATLEISAADYPGTFRGQFDLLIYGKSGKAEHKTQITVVVPYYEVTVSPSSVTITKGQTATYDIKINPSQHFTKEVSFTLSGLPSEETGWEIALKGNKVTIASATDLALKITTTQKTPTGTYNLTLKIEGGGVKNQITLTLTIK